MDQWFTQDNGDVTKGMVKEKKISSKEGITIRGNFLMINIVVRELSKGQILCFWAHSKMAYLKDRD